jgi:hypothetical protein
MTRSILMRGPGAERAAAALIRAGHPAYSSGETCDYP